MARLNPFNNIYDLFETYGICKRRAATWRLTIPSEGQIQGLPRSHGTLLATDGVRCLIKTASQASLFEGHLDYFEIWKSPHYPKSPTTVVCVDGEVMTVGSKARRAKEVQLTDAMVNTLTSL